jgi:hypothetical protein
LDILPKHNLNAYNNYNKIIFNQEKIKTDHSLVFNSDSQLLLTNNTNDINDINNENDEKNNKQTLTNVIKKGFNLFRVNNFSEKSFYLLEQSNESSNILNPNTNVINEIRIENSKSRPREYKFYGDVNTDYNILI